MKFPLRCTQKKRFETIFNEGIETEFISIERIIRSGKLAMSHHIKMNYCQTFTNATAAKDLKKLCTTVWCNYEILEADMQSDDFFGT